MKRPGGVAKNKESESTLLEAKHKSLCELPPDCLIAFNAKWIVTYINDAFTKATGFSKGEVVGQHFTRIKRIIKSKLPRHLEINSSLMKGKRYEFVLLSKDGSTRYAETIHILPKEQGKEKGVEVVFRDVTEQKNMEDVLRESEERYRAIFEGASMGILAADVTTRKFIFANPSICEMTGYSQEELLKLKVEDIHPKKGVMVRLDEFNRMAEGKISEATSVPVLRKDKTLIYCDVRTKHINVKGRKLLVGFFTDPSENRKAEEQLQKLNLELQSRVEELEQFRKIAIGRELKMIELKKRIGELESKLSNKRSD